MIAWVVHELWRVHGAVNTAVLVNTNRITSLRSQLAAEQRLRLLSAAGDGLRIDAATQAGRD